MELRKANLYEVQNVARVVGRKHLDYITVNHLVRDYNNNQLYVVVEGEKILAIVSLVPEPDYEYIAIKRLCVLNKGNCGKGIGSFAVRELSKVVSGERVGATPWTDNIAMRNLLESEGYQLKYVFNERWCFYAKDQIILL